MSNLIGLSVWLFKYQNIMYGRLNYVSDNLNNLSGCRLSMTPVFVLFECLDSKFGDLHYLSDELNCLFESRHFCPVVCPFCSWFKHCVKLFTLFARVSVFLSRLSLLMPKKFISQS